MLVLGVRVRVGVTAGLQQGVTAPDLALSRPPRGCTRVQVEKEPCPPADRLGRVDLCQGYRGGERLVSTFKGIRTDSKEMKRLNTWNHNK